MDREDQNADQEYLDIGVDEDLFAGEKEETSSNRNNNNAKTPTKNQPAKNQPTKKKDTVPVPETDRRRTYFFLTPGTKKANIAAEENHARQLNVHGLPSEFLECQAGGVQDNALYQLFMKLGKDKIGRHTLVFFGNFRSEIQTWESTSFGAKLGENRGNQQVFTKQNF